MIKTMEESKISNAFDSFIETRRTASTKKKYKFCVDKFFIDLFGVDTKHIKKELILTMSYGMVFKDFIKAEREKGVKDSTIATNLHIVSSFFDHLGKENVYPDVNIVKIKKDYLNTNVLIDDIEHINPMSKKDLENLKKWLTDRQYKSDNNRIGEKYAMLVDFMFVTAIRSTATFKIKWDQFQVIEWNGSKFAKLIVVDKGVKKNVKFLPYQYYQKMVNVLYKGDDNEYIFGDLNKNNLVHYMDQFSVEFDKKITPHSLKVGAGTYVYSITKDIVKTSRFLDHESVETTMKYIRDNGNPNESGSVIASRNNDYSKLKELSNEQLLSIISRRDELKNIIYTEGIQLGYIKE
ncbi:site-specific integrase [Liquorilactobacillus mali]|uniref:Phage integrase n=1 Tax=Liquorilactobacillus mali KCTC 3596 = DSM 20444 TaxID=1046596 RepID=A0A0R2EE16_9LACO|nr:site-specific integrase [Liquorilactobacillus mali]KRN10780.1 phage integrase [Liquorilactobacillus mali KCTC 3596 = DSM 20444]